MLAQFGDVYTVLSIVSTSFLLNDCILKLSNNFLPSPLDLMGDVVIGTEREKKSGKRGGEGEKETFLSWMPDRRL